MKPHQVEWGVEVNGGDWGMVAHLIDRMGRGWIGTGLRKDFGSRGPVERCNGVTANSNYYPYSDSLTRCH